MPVTTCLAASPAVCRQASGGLVSKELPSWPEAQDAADPAQPPRHGPLMCTCASAAGPAAEPVVLSRPPPQSHYPEPPKHPVPVPPATQLQTRSVLLHELSWDLTGDAPSSHPPPGLPEPAQLPSSIPQTSLPPSRLPLASQLPCSIPKMPPPPRQQQPPSAQQICRQPRQDIGACHPSTTCIPAPLQDRSLQPGRTGIAVLWEGSPVRLDAADVLTEPAAELAVLPLSIDQEASGPPRALQHASSTADSWTDPAAHSSSAHSPAASPPQQPVPGIEHAPHEDSTQQRNLLNLTGRASPPDSGFIDPWASSTDSLQYPDRPQVADLGSSVAQRWSPIRAGGTLPAGVELPAHESADAATGGRCCLDYACLSDCSDVQQPPHPGLHICFPSFVVIALSSRCPAAA